MRIIVPIKQVPETSDVRMDPESGTIVREGRAAVINPLDLYAIETALRLREEHGGTVHAISMGPSRAEVALREAVAMGCDEATLVSDRRFGGSDTWATSYVLAAAIGSLGKFDLVICGERATDGDTGQVGPGIAAWMDLPVVTYVARLEVQGSAPPHGAAESSGYRVSAERLIETGYQSVAFSTPALITVVKEIGVPRLPTLSGKKQARRATIPVLDRTAMELDASRLGLKGSPTKVVRIQTPKVTRGGRTVDGREDPELAADAIVRFLAERDLTEARR